MTTTDHFRRQSLLLGRVGGLELAQDTATAGTIVRRVTFLDGDRAQVDLARGGGAEIEFAADPLEQVKQIAEGRGLSSPPRELRGWDLDTIENTSQSWGQLLHHLYSLSIELTSWGFEPDYVSVERTTDEGAVINLRTVKGETRFAIDLTELPVSVTGDMAVALLDGYAPAVDL